MANPADRTVLLTLGRLPKALDLARAFHSAGWRVLIAEPYRWHLCRVSVAVSRSFVVPPPAQRPAAYLDALLDIVRREQVSLVVPVSEEAMHAASLQPMLPVGVAMYAMPPQLLHRLHSKLEFPRFAQSLGLDAPKTFATETSQAVDLIAHEDCVLKPVRSCSGRGVTFLSSGSALPTNIEPSVLQKRVIGREVSSFTIAKGGRVCCTVLYRATLKAGTVAVGFERIEQPPLLRKWIEHFVQATGYSGFLSFDFIIDEQERPWAIECNPRVTSGIHFLHHEDLVEAMLSEEVVVAPRLRKNSRMQQFYPALTETQASLFSGRWAANFKILRTSRDVTWSVTDPWPLLSMPLTSLNIILRSLRERRSMGEVATTDILFSG